ncbi:MAG: methyltransferase domain-containing protein [Ignavibacteriae bacterium]|nr:methyltransferase domain-containing protein [Ignavibacteriota bacterium]
MNEKVKHNKIIIWLYKNIFAKGKVGRLNDANRENWVKSQVEKIPNGLKILDAGAGELRYKKFCSHLDYISQDFSQYDGSGDSTGLQMGSWDQSKIDIISDITAIPMDNESIDVILCVEVLEHVPEPIKVISEFSRLLKKNGKLILTAPFNSLTHFAPFHFSTGFNKYFYEKHLSENGFEILEINKNGNYFEYTAQELRRLPEVSKRYTGKNIFLSRLLIKLLLITLGRLSSKDKGSDELLCYGYHILAEKK